MTNIDDFIKQYGDKMVWQCPFCALLNLIGSEAAAFVLQYQNFYVWKVEDVLRKKVVDNSVVI